MAFEAISETYKQEIEKEHLEKVYNFLLECDSGIYALEIKMNLKNMGRK